MRKTCEDYVLDGIERMKESKAEKLSVEKQLQLFFSAFPLRIFYGRGFGNRHGSSPYIIEVEEIVNQLNAIVKESK